MRIQQHQESEKRFLTPIGEAFNILNQGFKHIDHCLALYRDIIIKHSALIISCFFIFLSACNNNGSSKNTGTASPAPYIDPSEVNVPDHVAPNSYQTPIGLNNPGAELNPGEHGAPLDSSQVYGWEATGPCFYMNNYVSPGNGSWRINMGENCSVFQMTDHKINQGEAFSLTFDASSFSGLADSITAVLYVKDNLGVGDITISQHAFTIKNPEFNNWNSYQMVIGYNDLNPHIGKQLGLRFLNTSTEQAYLAFDNVLLEVHELKDLKTETFADIWSDSCEQFWVGKNFWANRLHDWEVTNGRLQTRAPQQSRLRRTVHRISSIVTSRPANFSLQVETGTIGNISTESSYQGFLLGAGFRLDHRAASLIHNRHGKNGGIIAGVDHNGHAFIRDNDINPVVLANANSTVQFDTESLKLSLDVSFEGNSQYEIKITVLDVNGESMSSARTIVPAERVMGNIGLLSSPGKQPLTTHWFNNFTGSGEKLLNATDRQFGPIMFTSYSLSRKVLTVNAQMPPVCRDQYKNVRLEAIRDNQWVEIADAEINFDAFVAQLRVFDWDDIKSRPIRVAVDVHKNESITSEYYLLTIQADPIEKNDIVLVGFTGRPGVILSQNGWIQQNSLKAFSWTEARLTVPHKELLVNAKKHNPDLIVFTGDQIYEFDPNGFIDKTSEENQISDYLYKWYLYGWSARDFIRNTPTIIIPDDHDVFQGNLWGEGGRHSDTEEGGGYVHPSKLIKIVEATQTGSLPPPFDSTPVAQGIDVYYTDLVYGGIGVAVLEDRKFKSGPHSTNRPRELLGQRQHKFLEQWAADWEGQEMKLVVSQAPFAMSHTHSGAGFNRSGLDRDSNGWPSDRRDEAVSLFRAAFAPHFTGDQHLALTLKHGIDNPRDAVYSFSVPSMLNVFPRVWDPANTQNGPASRQTDYTGSFIDQHGNYLDVLAAANPNLYYTVDDNQSVKPPSKYDLGTGYGVVQINKSERSYTVAAWPINSDPDKNTDKPYDGWPITLLQRDNDGRTPVGYLSEVLALVENPVVTVIDESNNKLVYAIRLQQARFRAPVYKADALYTIKLSHPESGYEELFTHMKVVDGG